MIVILSFKVKGGICIKSVHGLEYPILSDISKEVLEEIKSKGEKITISMDARECAHHKENKKNIFVGIQKILPIKGNRWMAIGQSFNGLHDVLIFSGKGEDENFAKTIRILRGGLKAAT